MNLSIGTDSKEMGWGGTHLETKTYIDFSDKPVFSLYKYIQTI